MITFTSIASSSSGNCYLLTSGEHRLLIDAGIPIARIRKALDYKLSSVDGCLITHSHNDHLSACKDLIKWSVDCYLTKETAEKAGVDGRRVRIIEPTGLLPPDPPYHPFWVNNHWQVWAFPAEHDTPGAVAFLVTDGEDRLLFLIDSYYFQYVLPGINIMALGCNYSPETLSPTIDPSLKRRLLTAHMSLQNCIKLMKDNDLSKTRSIFLLHLSDSNSSEEHFKNEVQKATGIPVYVAAK